MLGVYKLQLFHYPRISLNVGFPLHHSFQRIGVCLFRNVRTDQESHFWNPHLTSMKERLQDTNMAQNLTLKILNTPYSF